MRLKKRCYPSKVTTHHYESLASLDALDIIHSLCGLLFGSTTPLEVKHVSNKIVSFISFHQLLFYYAHVPLIIPNLIFHKETIIQNIYMFKLIRKNMDKNGMLVRGTGVLINKYKQKYNLL
jgi:hypothetical protein